MAKCRHRRQRDFDAPEGVRFAREAPGDSLSDNEGLSSWCPDCGAVAVWATFNHRRWLHPRRTQTESETTDD